MTCWPVAPEVLNFLINFHFLQEELNSWLLMFVFLTSFAPDGVVDGKYLVLPSGELHIRDVGPEDGYKSYKCRTVHKLTGETRLSATAGRLVITGKSPHFFSNFF